MRVLAKAVPRCRIVSVRAWPDAWCSWRSAACNTCKHGGYSCESSALRKQIAELARNARQLVETIGWQRIFS